MPTIRITSSPTNNTELVVNLMEFSPRGALGQVFICEAIRSYAETIAATPLEQVQSGPFFNAQAWQDVARDVKARCDAFYGRHTADTERG